MGYKRRLLAALFCVFGILVEPSLSFEYLIPNFLFRPFSFNFLELVSGISILCFSSIQHKKKKRKITALVGWSLFTNHPSQHHRHHHRHLPIWLLELSVLFGQSNPNYKNICHRHPLLFTLYSSIHTFSLTHTQCVHQHSWYPHWPSLGLTLLQPSPRSTSKM